MSPKIIKKTASGLWSGRDDGDRFHNLVKIISDTKEIKAQSLTIIGYPIDEGIKRNKGNVGASQGPDVLRKRLAKLAYHSPAVIYDAGNIENSTNNLEEAQDRLYEAIKEIASKESVSIVFGGGHDFAWPQFRGVFDAFPTESIGIINIDAHFDLRPGKSNSGTSFNQIASYLKGKQVNFNYFVYGIQPEVNTDRLFKKAKDISCRYITSNEIHLDYDSARKELFKFTKSHKVIYLTICLDVFMQSFAPGVSARSPMGLFPWQVASIIEELAATGKIAGFGIAELSPTRDINNLTANLAAHLVGAFINNFKS